MSALTNDVDLQLTAADAAALADDYGTYLASDGPRRQYQSRLLHLGEMMRRAVAAASPPATITAIQTAIDTATAALAPYQSACDAALAAHGAKLAARIAASPYAGYDVAGTYHDLARGCITLRGVDDQAVVGAIVGRMHRLVRAVCAAHPGVKPGTVFPLVLNAIRAKVAAADWLNAADAPQDSP